MFKIIMENLGTYTAFRFCGMKNKEHNPNLSHSMILNTLYEGAVYYLILYEKETEPIQKANYAREYNERINEFYFSLVDERTCFFSNIFLE